MKKPIIGVTSAWSVESWGDCPIEGGYYYVGKPYVEAVYKYGGIPMILAPEYTEDTLDIYLNNIVNSVDGLLFSGGGDQKKIHDPLPIKLRDAQPVRYDFEAELMKKAYEKDIPILGICRGFQMIVEGFGGYLDENAVIGHKQEISGSYPSHRANVNLDSKLFEFINSDTWEVNSFHIQKVGAVPDGFIVSAISDDHVVEGIESMDYSFLVGYQFHPEELQRTDDIAGNIFEGFIGEARKRLSNISF